MTSSITETSIEKFICALIAKDQGLKEEDISITEKFDQFNLDSLSKLSIAYEIEQEFKLDYLNPGVLSEFDTINKLATWIKSKTE